VDDRPRLRSGGRRREGDGEHGSGLDEIGSEVVSWSGAVEVVRSSTGVHPLRFPAQARAQFPDEMCAMFADHSCGVRLRCSTQARRLEVELRATGVRFEPALGQPFVIAADLVVDGRHAARRVVEEAGADVVDLTAERPAPVRIGGRTATLRFGPLPGGTKTVELWLPHNASCDVLAVRADAPLEAAPVGARPRWTHYGSSISHCLESPGPLGTWPAVTARVLDLDLTNLSIAGNALLDPFAARTVRDRPAELLSLKLGINVVNSDALRRRTLAPFLDGFLDTVREGHPDTPLLVVTPISCPMHEDAGGPTIALDRAGRLSLVAAGTAASGVQRSLSLRDVREIVEAVVRRRQRDDAHLHLLDGLSLLGAREAGALTDGLHPSPAGYRLIGHRFAAALVGMGLAARPSPRGSIVAG
jgi:hypothetical protein